MYFLYIPVGHLSLLCILIGFQVCETLKSQKTKRQINAFFTYYVYASHPPGFRTCSNRCGQDTVAKVGQIFGRANVFSALCGDVLLFVRTSFPKRAHKFYCPQLWVVRPTVMGCITHSYGLYNPQLWAVKFLLTKRKTSAHIRKNICSSCGEIKRIS